MKKIVVAVVFVVLIGVAVKMKTGEWDRNAEITEQYFIEACGTDQACIDRLIQFRSCYSSAYRLSLVPGGDTVDVDQLIDCLNGRYPIPKLDALRDQQLPFPTR